MHRIPLSSLFPLLSLLPWARKLRRVLLLYRRFRSLLGRPPRFLSPLGIVLSFSNPCCCCRWRCCRRCRNWRLSFSLSFCPLSFAPFLSFSRCLQSDWLPAFFHSSSTSFSLPWPPLIIHRLFPTAASSWFFAVFLPVILLLAHPHRTEKFGERWVVKRERRRVDKFWIILEASQKCKRAMYADWIIGYGEIDWISTLKVSISSRFSSSGQFDEWIEFEDKFLIILQNSIVYIEFYLSVL